MDSFSSSADLSRAPTFIILTSNRIEFYGPHAAVKEKGGRLWHTESGGRERNADCGLRNELDSAIRNPHSAIGQGVKSNGNTTREGFNGHYCLAGEAQGLRFPFE